MASVYLSKKIVQSTLNLIPNGQLFTVVFKKINGTERTLTCKMLRAVKRTGDKKYHPDLQVVETVDGRKSFYISRVFELRALGAVIKTRVS